MSEDSLEVFPFERSLGGLLGSVCWEMVRVDCSLVSLDQSGREVLQMSVSESSCCKLSKNGEVSQLKYWGWAKMFYFNILWASQVA